MVVDQQGNFTSLRERSHGRRSQFQASKMTAYDHIFFATKQTIEKYVTFSIVKNDFALIFQKWVDFFWNRFSTLLEFSI